MKADEIIQHASAQGVTVRIYEKDNRLLWLTPRSKVADPLLSGLTFRPVPVHADKVTRALPVIAQAEQGRLLVVRAHWNREFLDELCSFPEGRHDDQVDALSAAYEVGRQYGRGSGSIQIVYPRGQDGVYEPNDPHRDPPGYVSDFWPPKVHRARPDRLMV